MTLAFMHYGPIRALVNFNEFMREFNEVKKQTDKAQQDAIRTANVRGFWYKNVQGNNQFFVL